MRYGSSAISSPARAALPPSVAPILPSSRQGHRSRASPVERNVLAGTRRPLEFVTKRVDGTDRRLAPGYELWAGSCLGAWRVHELRILSRQACRSRQRLCPGLDLPGDLRSPVGAVGRDLECDPCAL